MRGFAQITFVDYEIVFRGPRGFGEHNAIIMVDELEIPV
jgi:hypothetical protein